MVWQNYRPGCAHKAAESPCLATECTAQQPNRGRRLRLGWKM